MTWEPFSTAPKNGRTILTSEGFMVWEDGGWWECDYYGNITDPDVGPLRDLELPKYWIYLPPVPPE